jgi:D-threo-aldose 1-dehydrogenase
MRTVTLDETGLTTSALGYGCAGLMRPPTAGERSALLEVAYDGGIRHFDVARYYGHGGAEGVLGKFLAESNRRDEVTIATKFGMEPSPLAQSSLGKRIMSSARRLAAVHPRIRKLLSGFAGRTIRTNRFDPESARLSLETSLRELRTDHIDLFLLHEANLQDTETPGLLEFLHNAKGSGKIRAFGLGSEYLKTLEIITHAPAFTRIIQVANGFGHWNLRRLPLDGRCFVITHGALKILPALESAFSRESMSLPTKSNTSSFESVRSCDLAGLLLGLAMHENSRGIILFSSTQPQRIRQNIAKALQTDSLASADWSAFQRAAEQHLDTFDVH